MFQGKSVPRSIGGPRASLALPGCFKTCDRQGGRDTELGDVEIGAKVVASQIQAFTTARTIKATIWMVRATGGKCSGR
jgi:hypothetical protein